MNLRAFLRESDRNVAVLALFVMILLVLAQVIMRVVFLAPLVGAEEFVRYLLIWVVFIGAPFATRRGGQIRMDELQNFMPKAVRYAVRLLSFISGVGVFGIIALSAIITTLHNLTNRTATLSIPFWIFFLPTILGFVLATLESALLFFGFLKNPERGMDSGSAHGDMEAPGESVGGGGFGS
ncbi:MAG TPA: TRAP transporter small permease [Spirochaetia bacterium]|nr:TRAP transporter small permease [Spirochaetia bacterium]